MQHKMKGVAAIIFLFVVAPAFIVITVSMINAGGDRVWIDLYWPCALNGVCLGLGMLSTLPIDVDAFFADHIWAQAFPYMLNTAAVFLAAGAFVHPIFGLGALSHLLFFVSGCRLRRSPQDGVRLPFPPTWSEVHCGLNGIIFNLQIVTYLVAAANASLGAEHSQWQILAVYLGHAVIFLVSLGFGVDGYYCLHTVPARLPNRRRIAARFMPSAVGPQTQAPYDAPWSSPDVAWYCVYCWLFFSGCQVLFVFIWSITLDTKVQLVHLNAFDDFRSQRMNPSASFFLIAGLGWIIIPLVISMHRHQLFRFFSAPFDQERRLHHGAFIAALLADGVTSEEALLEEASKRLQRLPFANISLDLLSSSPRDDTAVVGGHFALSEACDFGAIDCFVTHSWSDEPQAKFAALCAFAVEFKQKYGREPTLCAPTHSTCPL
jgi:hypothetical protein